jgi:hypothetical protein
VWSTRIDRNMTISILSLFISSQIHLHRHRIQKEIEGGRDIENERERDKEIKIEREGTRTNLFDLDDYLSLSLFQKNNEVSLANILDFDFIDTE